MNWKWYAREQLWPEVLHQHSLGGSVESYERHHLGYPWSQLIFEPTACQIQVYSTTTVPTHSFPVMVQFPCKISVTFTYWLLNYQSLVCYINKMSKISVYFNQWISNREHLLLRYSRPWLCKGCLMLHRTQFRTVLGMNADYSLQMLTWWLFK